MKPARWSYHLRRIVWICYRRYGMVCGFPFLFFPFLFVFPESFFDATFIPDKLYIRDYSRELHEASYKFSEKLDPIIFLSS